MTITIQRQDNSKVYKMTLVQDYNDPIRESGTPISIPGKQAEDQIIFTLTGQQGTVQISFIMYENGDDRSNGTSDDAPIETAQEQKEYLKYEFFDATPGTQYLITGPTHLIKSGGLKVGVPKFNPRKTASKPTEIQAELRFEVGTVV